jgi:hypothetical protein
MKATKPTVILAVLALTSAACGPSREEQQAAEIEKSAQEMQKGAENMAKGAEEMARSMSSLASGLGAAFGGDPNAKPADPVSFRDLQAVLPELSGWERDKPTGERMTAPVNFSEASVSHTRGDASISTKITDSALNQMLIAPFAMFLAGNYERETDRGYEKSIEVGEHLGFEKWDTEDKDGELTVIVNKRFIVAIEGRNIDNAKVLHDVLARTDLAKLAALK